MAFIDLEKAFDNVDWNKMFNVLKRAGFKYRGRRIIANIYQNQLAKIKIQENEKEAAIKKKELDRVFRCSLSFSICLLDKQLRKLRNSIALELKYRVKNSDAKICGLYSPFS